MVVFLDSSRLQHLSYSSGPGCYQIPFLLLLPDTLKQTQRTHAISLSGISDHTQEKQTIDLSWNRMPGLNCLSSTICKSSWWKVLDYDLHIGVSYNHKSRPWILEGHYKPTVSWLCEECTWTANWYSRGGLTISSCVGSLSKIFIGGGRGVWDSSSGSSSPQPFLLFWRKVKYN